MWLSAVKLALNAGTHIYKKRQETKMAMADAQHMAATKMARGETEYQGKLLEARQADYKDEVVLLILTLPILVLAYGVTSEADCWRRWNVQKTICCSSISNPFDL